MNTERLLKLADHLLNGQLGHKVFDFNNFNGYRIGEDKHYIPSPNVCGTVGCAIGECPIVWPDIWKFDEYGDPVLIEDMMALPSDNAERFFDLDCNDVWDLLYPGNILHTNSTKEEVANNIIRFVKGEPLVSNM